VVSDCGGVINSFDIYWHNLSDEGWDASNDESYKLCYQNKGFWDVSYWSSDTHQKYSFLDVIIGSQSNDSKKHYNSTNALILNFNIARAYDEPKNYKYIYVRCVREK